MHLRLSCEAPFRLDLTVAVLRRLPMNAVDRWEDGAWRRMIVIDGLPAACTVVQQGAEERPELAVSVDGIHESSFHRRAVAGLLDKLLGLHVRLDGFYRLAAGDEFLAPLAERFRGFRPPRYSSPFEALVNGIACQQISLAVGLTLLNRLARAYGFGGESAPAFPVPENLMNVQARSLRRLGFSERKSENIIVLARAIAKGQLDLRSWEALNDEELVERLQTLPGVGPWTAQYTALRGYGRLDSFPVDDVGGQERVRGWLGLPERPNGAMMARLLEGFRPYRGLLYFLLLLDSLERRKLLEASPALRQLSPTRPQPL